MTTMELMLELVAGKRLVDLDDYEPGKCSNGGRYYFVFRLDSEYRLWSLCSYEDSEWQLISDSLAESWKLLKGVNWTEEAKWVNEPRWQVW